MDDFRLTADEPAAPVPTPAVPQKKERRAKDNIARRECTPLELERAEALSRCRFTPGAFDKQFARDTAPMLQNSGQITEKQAACIERMAWRYRRQMPERLVPGAQPPLPWKKPA